MPRVGAPLPLEARSVVANAAIVTAFRPGTYLSFATATDPNMRALRVRVAGDPEVRGLCGALDNTRIRVRLHRQLPVGRVPDIVENNKHVAVSQLARPGNRPGFNCRTPSCRNSNPSRQSDFSVFYS